MNVVFIFDAHPSIGGGHAVRCSVLARALIKKGIQVSCIAKIDIGWISSLFQVLGISVYPVSGLGLDGDVSVTGAALLSCLRVPSKRNIVIVDDYRYSSSAHKVFCDMGFLLCVFDDYAHLGCYTCDVLINQNSYAKTLHYVGAVNAFFLGPKYALIREEVKALFRPVRSGKMQEIENVGIGLGAGDRRESYCLLAQILKKSSLSHCHFYVVSTGPYDDDIYSCFFEAGLSVQFVQNNIQIYSKADMFDMFIAGAGSTCWELCFLGIPFITVVLGEDQVLVARDLEHRAIALSLGRLQAWPTLESEKFLDFFKNSEMRSFSAQMGMKLIDGYGDKRLVNCLEQKW